MNGLNDIVLVQPGELTALSSEREGRGEFRMTRPMVWIAGDCWLEIPADFVTDGASIPFWARWAFNSWGKAGAPAVLHDFLLTRTAVPKWACDWLFYEALKSQAMHPAKAWLMYMAVHSKLDRRGAGDPISPQGGHRRDHLSMMTNLLRSLFFALAMLAFLLITGILRGLASYRASPDVKTAKALAAAAASMGVAGEPDLIKARRVDADLLRAAIATGIRGQFAALFGPIFGSFKAFWVGAGDFFTKLGKGLADIGAREINRTIHDVLMNLILLVVFFGGAVELVLKPLASAAQGLGPDEGARTLILGLVFVLLAHDVLRRKFGKA